jgi:hypothetical protein
MLCPYNFSQPRIEKLSMLPGPGPVLACPNLTNYFRDMAHYTVKPVFNGIWNNVNPYLAEKVYSLKDLRVSRIRTASTCMKRKLPATENFVSSRFLYRQVSLCLLAIFFAIYQIINFILTSTMSMYFLSILILDTSEGTPFTVLSLTIPAITYKAYTLQCISFIQTFIDSSFILLS